MVSFTLALIRSIGHISLSSLHRQMQRDHENVCNDLSCKQSHCISRVQLRRLLISIDQEELKTLTNHYFAIELRQTDDLEWFALDGKELKGSIDKVMGEKRGENIILKVNHNQQSSQVIDFYSGQKESEKTTVKNYIQACSDLSNQAFSLDALHNSVSLLSLSLSNTFGLSFIFIVPPYSFISSPI